MIIGIGVDSIEISRVARSIKRRPGLLQRLFTSREISQLPGGTKEFSRMAAIFAAKEAALKALGTGLAGQSWQNIEVLHRPDGRPDLILQGKTLMMANKLGVKRIHLSLTHDRRRAVAFCVMEGGSAHVAEYS